ncbi:DUF6580 family putative transport protein [Bremerella sp. T1]|uniref:DUF6580 family putative transport protein n=1 Tax=Bremerella sp. TYQ1 TaxID=3119568 RepID=UPI001CCB474F|nr:DUF6580 family putative transport protein [Bremerella volcania]UBM34081.1 hypothetical protein LA756_15475 [Bremerella volcania]
MPEENQTPNHRSHHLRIWLVVGLCLAYCVFLRVLPYALTAMGAQNDWFSQYFPWSLTPILAVGMFAGAMMSNRYAAAGVMLASLVLSDLGIWAASGHFDWAFYPGTPFNYICLTATILAGYALRNDRSWIKPIGMGVLASVAYFLVSNFGSWLTLEEYPKTAQGLVQCYVSALPFYRNLLAGTCIGTVLLFCPAVLNALAPRETEATDATEPGSSVAR